MGGDASDQALTLRLPPVKESPLSQQQTELLEALGVRDQIPILHPTCPDTIHPELLDALRVRALKPADAYFCRLTSSWGDEGVEASKQDPRRSCLSALSPQGERETLQLLFSLAQHQLPSLFPPSSSSSAQPPSSSSSSSSAALKAVRSLARVFCSHATQAPLSASNSAFAREYNAYVQQTAASDCVAMAGDSGKGGNGSAGEKGKEGGDEERERGLVATREVEAGERVLRIRRELLISVDAAMGSEIGHVFRRLREEEQEEQKKEGAAKKGRGEKEGAEEGEEGEEGEGEGEGKSELHDDTIAMLFLLYERRKGDASRWKTYFKCIPTQFKTAVTALGEEEGLEELLEGTPVLARAEGERQMLRALYDSLLPALKERFPETFEGGGFEWEDFLWARAVFDTRCITVKLPTTRAGEEGGESEEGGEGGRDVTCLVPMADMCNHDIRAQLSKPVWDSESGSLGFHSLAPISSGDQIFLNYGPLSNMDLLLYYGFALDENPYDKIELQLQPDEEEGDLAMMKRVLLAHCRLDGDHFLRRSGGFSPKLLGALRLLHLQRDDLSLTDLEPEAGPITAANEEAVITTLEATVASLLESLPPPPAPRPTDSAFLKSAARYKQGLREILIVNQEYIAALRKGLEAWRAEREEQAGSGEQGDEGEGGSGKEGGEEHGGEEGGVVQGKEKRQRAS